MLFAYVSVLFLSLLLKLIVCFTSLTTRYTSKDILTIREAVWLTDNTYKYEDLVRMMGEVIAVLEGKIRVRFNICISFISHPCAAQRT